ncbi:MAG: apolipoprotein N-acyltransferase [Akkermansiaceae bacterium]
MSLLIRSLIALASGCLLAMVFPGWNFSILVWAWMIPLLAVVWQGERKRYGFGMAYLAGLGFWLLNLKWIWTVSGIGSMGLAAFLALYFGLWGMVAVTVGNPWRKRKNTSSNNDEGKSGIEAKLAAKLASKGKTPPLGLAVAAAMSSLKFAFINAAAWVGFEWLRGWLFTGFGWNGLGVAFHETPILAQAADLVGVTGLAFVPVFMSAVLVQTVKRMAAELKEGKLRPRLDFGVAVLLIALQFCYGVWRVKNVNGWDTQRVRVLLVQQNIPQDLKWDELAAQTIMDEYAESTRVAMADLDKENARLAEETDGEAEMKQPDLVIWPESAVPFPLMFSDDFDGYEVTGAVGHLFNEEVRPLGAFTFITGMNEREVEYREKLLYAKEDGAVYNSVVVIPPGGRIRETTTTHHKSHLVIFGEYIPLKEELPFLADLFKFSSGQSFVGNMNPGRSTEPMVVNTAEGDLQVIPSVCFEDSVGRLTRRFVRQKPQIIVNLTNDGWFKESEAAEQHMANAKFRAIELRRPMVRCANTGVSGIISSTGSSYDQVTEEKQLIMDENGNHFVRKSLYGNAYAPSKGSISFYALAGDVFSWLMMACVFVAAIKYRFQSV